MQLITILHLCAFFASLFGIFILMSLLLLRESITEDTNQPTLKHGISALLGLPIFVLFLVFYTKIQNGFIRNLNENKLPQNVINERTH